MFALKSRSLWAILRHVEDIERVVEDGFRFVLQEPFISGHVGEEVSREVGNTYHDGAAGVIEGPQFRVADAVNSGIDGAEVREVNGFARMRILEFLERDQALPPIGVAVRE